MAINKVNYGNNTLMDLTDTTAEAEDVMKDKVFYGKDGVRTLGTKSSDIFVITYDTTFAEIKEAIEAEKDLMIKGQFDDNVCQIIRADYSDEWITLTWYSGMDGSSDMVFNYVNINVDSGWGTVSSLTNQKLLESGVNIKTINNQSLLGSGNIAISVPQYDEATDDVLGLIKTNSAQSVTLNADGQLVVGGRMGQFEGTTGLFAPNDREPRNVNNYSLLMTDAKGMNMTANRAVAVVSGLGLTCQSAPPNTTVYKITNNYNNRIIAKCCEGGFVAKDEVTSTQQIIEPVLSVTIGGQPFTPNSNANSSTPIEITVANSVNPDSTITSIRLFGTMNSYASLHVGNGIRSGGSGRCLMLGGGITKVDGNDNCIVGQNMFANGNGNAMFGRNHIATKNRSFLAGTGHDTSNAKSESASAVGDWSQMDSNTSFAVGNGTSQTARSNAFEVTVDGGVVLKSPNGTRYKITVDNSGNLTTTAL